MRSPLLAAAIFLFTIPSFAVRFDKACEPGDTILIGAVGDVLLHSPLQKQGYAQGFDTLWTGIQPYMAAPDIMYANLEGPAAAGVSRSGKDVKDPGPVFDDRVYTGYPLFNYHPSIIPALKNAGVDLVSTANNHSLDRGALGIERTIEALEQNGLNFFGTRLTENDNTFYTTTRQGGWNIAWIACTYSNNGLTDRKNQVLMCFDGRVSKLIAALKDGHDAVIVTPHWGNEYQTSASSQQKQYARQWLDEGATAIIGAHPHVLQQWEQYTTADGRQGFIHYSLGNFVSNQSPMVRQTSVLLYLTYKKERANLGERRALPSALYEPPPLRSRGFELCSKPQLRATSFLKLC